MTYLSFAVLKQEWGRQVNPVVSLDCHWRSDDLGQSVASKQCIQMVTYNNTRPRPN